MNTAGRCTAAAVETRMNEPYENENFCYRIDARDCVASVETEWLDFNGQPSRHRLPISIQRQIVREETVRRPVEQVINLSADRPGRGRSSR